MVLYGTRDVDLSWLPRDAPAVFVYNDDDPAQVDHPGDAVHHLRPDRNIGFGRAVNAALEVVDTSRVVLVNPDISADPEHWSAMCCDDPGVVRAVPLQEPDGTPTSIVNRYPNRRAMVASGLRLGRLAPRGGRLRRLAGPALGPFGRTHAELLAQGGGRWSLSDHWASAAFVSFDVGRLRSVGGFDPGYFLYWEDVDLCWRLSRRHRDMSIVVPEVGAARHAVGLSARSNRVRVEAIRLASARRYCRARGYRVCAGILAVRATALARRG